MFALGLTGSIATGKSTALKIFAEAGIPIYSADTAVYELYQNEAVAPVEAMFPGVAKNGVIDRQKLGQQLVGAPERIAELEKIVHPLVHHKMRQFLKQAEADNADMVVLEIPLLFETGHDYPIEAVAVTTCNDKEQRTRAMRRAGMTVEKLETILARQMPQAEKISRADFVIHTDTNIKDTTNQIAAIIKQIRQHNSDP